VDRQGPADLAVTEAGGLAPTVRVANEALAWRRRVPKPVS